MSSPSLIEATLNMLSASDNKKPWSWTESGKAFVVAGEYQHDGQVYPFQFVHTGDHHWDLRCEKTSGDRDFHYDVIIAAVQDFINIKKPYGVYIDFKVFGAHPHCLDVDFESKFPKHQVAIDRSFASIEAKVWNW